MLLRLALAMAAAMLAGCDGAHEARAQSASRQHERMQRAAEAAQQPPKVTRYRLEAGELIVLDIATIAPGGFADSQKCFVWRDSEFRTSTLACPQDTPANLPDIQ